VDASEALSERYSFEAAVEWWESVCLSSGRIAENRQYSVDHDEAAHVLFTDWMAEGSEFITPVGFCQCENLV